MFFSVVENLLVQMLEHSIDEFADKHKRRFQEELTEFIW